jgi:hypothetical protein
VALFRVEAKTLGTGLEKVVGEKQFFDIGFPTLKSNTPRQTGHLTLPEPHDLGGLNPVNEQRGEQGEVSNFFGSPLNRGVMVCAHQRAPVARNP